jgi:hypothetical protein
VEAASQPVVKAPEPSVAAPRAQVVAEESKATAPPVITSKVSEAQPENNLDESSPVAEGAGRGQVELAARAGENSDLRTAFRVKYVAQDAAYLDGGRSAGLTTGMKLVVRDLSTPAAAPTDGSDPAAAGDVAELEVLSVAETSSVTEIHTPKRPVKIGDLAYLSSADQQSLVERNALSATRKYPAVVSFTENDTLDDEARAPAIGEPRPRTHRLRLHRRPES